MAGLDVGISSAVPPAFSIFSLALAENACKVELVLTYAFGTLLLETAIGPVFDRIGRTFIDAFVQRAEKLHARKAR